MTKLFLFPSFPIEMTRHNPGDASLPSTNQERGDVIPAATSLSLLQPQSQPRKSAQNNIPRHWALFLSYTHSTHLATYHMWFSHPLANLKLLLEIADHLLVNFLLRQINVPTFPFLIHPRKFHDCRLHGLLLISFDAPGLKSLAGCCGHSGLRFWAYGYLESLSMADLCLCTCVI